MALTYSWTTIADAQVDDNSPCTSTLIGGLVRNAAICDQQVSQGYTRRRAHDHDGYNSALLTPAAGQNMLLNAAPNTTAWFAWVSSGVTMSATLGFQFQQLDDYVYQNVPGGDGSDVYGVIAQNMKTSFGTNGGNFAISLFVKAAGAPTTGALSIGLTDASASTFLTNGRAILNYSDVSTGWKRHWFVVSGIGGSLTTNLRFLIRATTGFDQSLSVAGIMMMPGSKLWPWHLCPLDSESLEFGKNAYMATQVPYWDWSVSMTNAQQIALG